MPWLELTEPLVKSALTSAELAKLAALRQSSKLPEIIRQTVAEIRGYVRKQVAPGEGQTIPESLLAAACAIVRFRCLASLPSESLATPQRQAEHDNALRLLRDVAEGKFLLEEASNPSSESSPVPDPAISPKSRAFNLSDQDGI